MTERKLLRHHVYIGVQLDATGKFTKTINCPFTPDEVKVKQLTANGAGAVRAYQVQCPTLTSDWKVPLCSFVEPATVFIGMTFTLGKSIDGSHEFSVVDTTGEVDTAIADEYLSIHLEFRKYA